MISKVEYYLEKFLALTLLSIVFLTPLLPSNSSFGYEQIKVVFFISVVTLAGVLYLICTLLNPKRLQLKWNNLKTAQLLFLLALLISSLLGSNPLQSLIGTPPYLQGWAFYAYLVLFGLLISVEKIKLKYWALAISISAFFVAVTSIDQFISTKFFNATVPLYAGRVVSTFGQPNFFSGFLLFSLPFVYILFSKKDKYLKILSSIIAAILIIGIIVSLSRASILVLFGLLIFFLLHKFLSEKAIFLIGTGLFILAIVLSLTLSSGLFWKEVTQPLANKNPKLTEQSLEKRVYIWPVILELISQKPILGYGLDNMSQAFSNYKPKEELRETTLHGINALKIDRSHNFTFDILFFSGFLGLLSWIYLVISLFKKLKHKAAFTFLVIFLIWVQFQNVSAVHLIYLWLIIGLIDQSYKHTSLDKAFN